MEEPNGVVGANCGVLLEESAASIWSSIPTPRSPKARDGGAPVGELRMFYSVGRGWRAITVVPMPPRGRKTPLISAQMGSEAFTTSSRTWLTMFS